MKELLKRLEEKVSDRDRLIKAIYKRFSPSDKMKRGGKHKVMFTGDVAKALNKGAYTSAFLQDLSDEELNKLVKLLGGKTEDITEGVVEEGERKYLPPVMTVLEMRPGSRISYDRTGSATMKWARDSDLPEFTIKRVHFGKRFISGVADDGSDVELRYNGSSDTFDVVVRGKSGKMKPRFAVKADRVRVSKR